MSELRPSKVWQLLSAALAYFLFGLGALCIGVFFRVLSVVPLIGSLRKQKWIRWWIHKGCLTFIRLLRLFGLVRYEYDSAAKQPALAGHILIANHPSLIDAVFMFAVNKNLCCFVKGALWHNFFTGAVARQAGFIPNNSPESVAMAVSKLQKGESLLIFPEGTRSQKGQDLLFKRGASNIAVASKAPIIPILIKCHPSVLKKEDAWYHIPDGGARFEFVTGPVLQLEQCIDTAQAKTLQYRQLTRVLQTFYQQWIVNGHITPVQPVQSGKKLAP
ncbi:lysophospholipid acyltransferase family protein [Glaciecola siphonariae]|uniref:Lysophospholipid acyltransferase family protein n=1 Tax=Glaciecola siphonariae TaxID=521012 RepID=A0ABV9LZ25_9ALTE